MKTPIARCIELGLYAKVMLAKFPESPAVAPLSDKIGASTQALGQAQAAYDEAMQQRVVGRAEVQFADHSADQHVRALQRTIEGADGVKRGRLAFALLPDGITAIIRPAGARQVEEMRALEGRLDAMGSIWKAAVAEKAKLTAERQRFEAALAMRRATLEAVEDMRARRDAAKQQFLDVYAQVTAQVKAAFPRNREMQDLFFDEVEDRRAPREPAEPQAPHDAGVGEGEPLEPGPQPPAGGVPRAEKEEAQEPGESCGVEHAERMAGDDGSPPPVADRRARSHLHGRREPDGRARVLKRRVSASTFERHDSLTTPDRDGTVRARRRPRMPRR